MPDDKNGYPGMPNTMTNGWAKWGKHVLAEMERQNNCITLLNDKVTQLQIDNAVLKMKSGIWGAIGALIPIVIALIIWIIKSGALAAGP